MTTFRSRWWGGLALLAINACAPVAPEPPRAPAPVEATASPRSKARWVERGVTRVGPAWGDETLVLLGGRRALLARSGELRLETAPAPELLEQIIVVPGARGPRVIGLGAQALHRFDDPLGPAVTLARWGDALRARAVGSLPDRVALWFTHEDRPRVLDLDGRVAPAPFGLTLPMSEVEFSSAREGTLILDIGAATTRDGGVTWAIDADGPGLRKRSLEPIPSDAPALRRWLGAEGFARTPLDVAVVEGLSLSPDRALIAGPRGVARVDLITGSVIDAAPCPTAPDRVALLDHELDRFDEAASIARAGRSILFSCPAQGQPIEDATALRTVVLDRPRLGLGDNPLHLARPARPITTSRGGALYQAACAEGPARGSAEGLCVLQPGGRWATFTPVADQIGLAPLADGRITFLRGVSSRSLGPGHQQSPGAPRVIVRDVSGAETEIPLTIGGARSEIELVGPVDETEQGELRLLLLDHDGEAPAQVVVQPLDGRPATVRSIEGALQVAMHQGRGLAITHHGVLESLDGGATWVEIGAPDLLVGGRLPGIELGEVGARIGRFVRVGWGPTEPWIARSPSEGGVELTPPLRPRHPSPASISCQSKGLAPGSPRAAESLDQLFPRAARGPRARVHRTSQRGEDGTRRGHVIVALEAEGPADAPRPATWALRWIDPDEVGGGVHTLRAPAPPGATWELAITFAAARGEHLFLELGAPSPRALVARVHRGRIEAAPAFAGVARRAAFDPSGVDLVVHTEAPARLVRWRAAEPPREIAHAPASLIGLGAPAEARVPILVRAEEAPLFRAQEISSGAAPVPLSMTGWIGAPSLVDPARLPACDATSPGPDVDIDVDRGPDVTLDDGEPLRPQRTRYRVRFDGARGCLARVSVELGSRSLGPTPADRAPADFVRIDLVKSRAEASAARALPGTGLRRLSCLVLRRP